jgi:7-cyano-7-deazaguanine synthase
MESAVVLLSGGIGSTVAAFCRRESAVLHPLYLNYGRASTRYERQAASAVAEALGAPLQVVDLPHVAQIAAGGSSLSAQRDQGEVPIPGPPGEVEGLTVTMLAVGAEYAAAVGADVLISGQMAVPPDPQSDTLSQERSVNPRELHHAFSIVLEAALPVVRGVKLATPLIDLKPFEAIKLGLRLGAPLERTWSCHRSGEPCGACPGCQARLTAFGTAGVSDPLLKAAVGQTSNP